MQVLVNGYAGNLLDARADELGADVELVRMTELGRLIVSGQERSRTDVQPEVAFASAHTFTDGTGPVWIGLLEELPSVRWLQSPAAGHLAFYDDLLARGVRITGAPRHRGPPASDR